MHSAFAAIEWGGAHHQVAVVDEDGREVSTARFARTRAGIDTLIGALGALEGQLLDRTRLVAVAGRPAQAGVPVLGGGG